MSFSSLTFTSGPLRLRIKPTWLNARCRTTIISLVWFFFAVDVFLSLSLSFSFSLSFLPSWKASTREASMKMKGLDVAPPPSPCQSQGSTPRREGWWNICTEWKIFLRVLVYMPADFSRDSSFDIWPVEKCTREWDDYRHVVREEFFKVNVELRRRRNDYDDVKRTGVRDWQIFVPNIPVGSIFSPSPCFPLSLFYINSKLFFIVRFTLNLVFLSCTDALKKNLLEYFRKAGRTKRRELWRNKWNFKWNSFI